MELIHLEKAWIQISIQDMVKYYRILFNIGLTTGLEEEISKIKSVKLRFIYLFFW